MCSMLFKKIYGCLLGGAIGDAMGGPVEGFPSYKELERRHGRVTSFLEHPRVGILSAIKSEAGTVTDDTRQMLLICDAIIAKGGRITIEDVERTMFQRFFSLTEKLGGLEAGSKEWRECYMEMMYIPLFERYHRILGFGPLQSPPLCYSATIAPIGIVNACNPRQAAQDAYGSARILAAAIAEAMKPDATVDSIIDVAIDSVDGLDASVDRIRKAVDLAKETRDVFELREPLYKHLIAYKQPPLAGMLRPDLVDALEMTPCVFGIFYAAKGEPREAILGAVNFGRDNDTMATMAGSLAGAFKGIDGLPREWMETVERVNPNIKERAQGLFRVVKRNLQELEDQIKSIQKII